MKSLVRHILQSTTNGINVIALLLLFVLVPGLLSARAISPVNLVENVRNSNLSGIDVHIRAEGSLTICDSARIRFHCTSGFSFYEWSDGQMDSVVTILFPKTGQYEIAAAVEDDRGKRFYSDTLTVSVVARPDVPVITQQDTLVITKNIQGCTYQWYYNDLPIGGPQSNAQKVFQAGWYKVRALNLLTACWRESAEYHAQILSDVTDDRVFDNLSMYPQPVTNDLHIRWSRDNALDVKVFNVRGECVLSQKDPGHGDLRIVCSELPAAVYVVECRSGNTMTRKIIVKTNE